MQQVATRLDGASNSADPHLTNLSAAITLAWKKIAPFWPLQNLIAVNPLQGFEGNTLPFAMQEINRETLKWCQVYFDEGQATISMPVQEQGLYSNWRELIVYDKSLHLSNAEHCEWLANLPSCAKEAILNCLNTLSIPTEKTALFLTLLLTTLPGWASYIKYKAQWTTPHSSNAGDLLTDYLALRLVITYLKWPQAKDLMTWHEGGNVNDITQRLQSIVHDEKNYQSSLVAALSKQTQSVPMRSKPALAQWVFCIDVRSEPLRRALEAQGDYDTYGFAGFFGIPLRVEDEIAQESYATCPVLCSPKHTIRKSDFYTPSEFTNTSKQSLKMQMIKNLYQSVKYTFTTPFALVEALGLMSGLWMLIKTILPTKAIYFKKLLNNVLQPNCSLPLSNTNLNVLSAIPLVEQCAYAENALRTIGLIKQFSPIVVICGHGSVTQNNPYASALDCGACAGHEGSINARLLAEILNAPPVRAYLAERAIVIPSSTLFVAALHQTTTDEVVLFLNEKSQTHSVIKTVQNDLQAATKMTSQWRLQQLDARSVQERSANWAQTRPEWGLARNATFIVGPRQLTKKINLEGRSFLHSYHFEEDADGSLLTTILTAPMIVAQWINAQYLFSSLNPVAYGGGSKITQNIVGKIGIMQGNSSDLMHGLSLQSVYSDYQTIYHRPMRLLTVVYASCALISKVITEQTILQKLFSNGWVSLVCITKEGISYHLQRDLTWKQE